jgi:hypothetical protein
MKTLVITLVFLFITIVCWLFATATVVNGEHNRMAFIIKSIFYWAAILLSLLLGYLMAI